MNYRKHYDLLIERAKTRKIPKGLYVEKHHIVPRSEGGTDDQSNLVHLYPREHFLAHWLLYRENPTMNRAFAFNMMSCDRLGVYRPSARAYQEGVEAAAKAQSLRQKGTIVVSDNMTGKVKYIRPEELDYYLELGWQRSRRGIGKDRFWCNNGIVEKYVKELPTGFTKGRLAKRTGNRKAMYKDNMLAYIPAEQVAQYERDGWNLGNSKHNKPWESLKGKFLTCPHCGKTGGYQGLKRWHFDNCKDKL